MTPSCDELRQDLAELTAGEFDESRRAELSAHVDACAACARLVALQTVLESELRALPAAPITSLAQPALPAQPARRARLLRFAAAVAAVAAVALVAVGFGSSPAHDAPREAAVVQQASAAKRAPVISKIVDMSGSGEASDDGLLALTAGLEAVAMRRPAKGR